MSIKSDRWIRRMAKAGMIEPFEEAQVRTQDGRKIVSYGTSSYGYDVRCAREFDFHQHTRRSSTRSTSMNNFVDFNGDVCSCRRLVALARTVEYFRIPRSAR